MYPKTTRVNVRCMPHHAVVVLSMSELLNSFEKSGKFCRYCVSCNIDLTVRDVALRPTGTYGQILYFRQLSIPSFSHYNKICQKINSHYPNTVQPRNRKLCGVWVGKWKLWSLFCVDAIMIQLCFVLEYVCVGIQRVIWWDLLHRGDRSRIDSTPLGGGNKI